MNKYKLLYEHIPFLYTFILYYTFIPYKYVNTMITVLYILYMFMCHRYVTAREIDYFITIYYNGDLEAQFNF